MHMVFIDPIADLIATMLLLNKKEAVSKG